MFQTKLDNVTAETARLFSDVVRISNSLSKAIVDFVKIYRFLTNLNRRKSTYSHSESTLIESIENFDFVDFLSMFKYSSKLSENHLFENSCFE